MNNLLQFLSFVLPIIASFSVLIVLGINLYLKVRRRFPVKVNCWFCNEWTKVHYDNRDSFDCPTCLQYNGFAVDGGYNKIIPAQHDELLNHKISHTQKSNETSAANGLCRICNNNQQLKMYQLANFIPLNEDNFDIEVELFREQLEKAYSLCSVCNHIVKKTISHQNKWLLGLKLTQLKKQSISLLDLNNASNGLTKESKQTYFLLFLHTSIVLCAVAIIINALYNFDSTTNTLNKVFPKYVVPYIMFMKGVYVSITDVFRDACNSFLISDSYKTLESIYSTSYEGVCSLKSSFLNVVLNNEVIESEQILNFSEQLKKCIHNYIIPKRVDVSYACISGLLLQIVASVLHKKKKIFVKILQVICWMLLTVMSFTQHTKKLAFFVSLLQIAAAVIIIYITVRKSDLSTSNMSCASSVKRKSRKKKKGCSKPVHDRGIGLLQNNSDSSFASIDSMFKSNLSAYDTDTAESDCSLSGSITSTSTKNKINCFSNVSCKTNHVFGQAAVFQNSFNKSPVSFEELNTTKSVFNDSFVSAISYATSCRDNSFTSSLNRNFDLNKSLDNLHLSAFNTGKITTTMRKEPVFIVNKDVTRPRPILSPPKLKTVSQNSWTAGGFWKNSDKHSVFVDNAISRSSSQSSGFVSQCNEPLQVNINKFNSLPSSRNNSSYEEHERFSLISEPAYHYNLPQQQKSFCAPKSFSGFSYSLMNTNSASTEINSKERYSSSLNHCTKLGPFDSHTNICKCSLSGFNRPSNINAAASNVTVRANSPFRNECVQSPFCTVNVDERQQIFCKPASPNTANIIGNNKTCSNVDNLCNVSIRSGSTYKTGSLFKTRNEIFYNL